MEQIPPQNIEAEEAYLGCVINDSNILATCQLLSDDFYLEKNKTLFKVLKWLFTKFGVIDIVSLADTLEKSKKLEEIGGRTYLVKLANSYSANPTNLEYLIKEKSNLRKIKEIGVKISESIYGEDETENLISKAKNLISQLEIVQERNDEIKPLKEIADTIKNNHTEHFSSGHKCIDVALGGGFNGGDLILVSGQTGMGKTSFCQDITYRFSEQGLPSLWFSYEVVVHHLWEKFKNMGVSDDFLSYAPVSNTTGNIAWIEQKIIEGKEKYNTKLIVIDHLGFLVPKNKSSGDNYSAFLGQICRDLKTIALKEEVIIILPVHMKKTDNPSINDIRDSSGIAQEADVVLIINREIEQNPEMTGQFYTQYSELTMAKNRKTGQSIKAFFSMQNNKYTHEPGHKSKKTKHNYD